MRKRDQKERESYTTLVGDVGKGKYFRATRSCLSHRCARYELAFRERLLFLLSNFSSLSLLLFIPITENSLASFSPPKEL